MYLVSSAIASFLSDDSHLTLPSTGPKKYALVEILNIRDGAPSDLFKSASSFRKLKGAGLGSTHLNGIYLEQLASNYQKIEGLSLFQALPLDDEHLLNLTKFVALQASTINCPLANFLSIYSVIPNCVRTLMLGEHNNICYQRYSDYVSLPNVEKQELVGTSLNESFLRFVRAPNLKPFPSRM